MQEIQRIKTENKCSILFRHLYTLLLHKVPTLSAVLYVCTLEVELTN